MPGVCKLTVVHEGLVAGSATLEQVSGGWPFILSGLKTLLETGKGLGEEQAGGGRIRPFTTPPPALDTAADRVETGLTVPFL